VARRKERSAAATSSRTAEARPRQSERSAMLEPSSRLAASTSCKRWDARGGELSWALGKRPTSRHPPPAHVVAALRAHRRRPSGISPPPFGHIAAALRAYRRRPSRRHGHRRTPRRRPSRRRDHHRGDRGHHGRTSPPPWADVADHGSTSPPPSPDVAATIGHVGRCPNTPLLVLIRTSTLRSALQWPK
jgi:hypothetical protein